MKAKIKNPAETHTYVYIYGTEWHLILHFIG